MGTPSIFCLKKLRNIDKPRERDTDDSSSISRLPDEIILEILNKLIDLRTLCSCYLVSRRLSSIVRQVDAISFTVPPLNPRIPDKNTVGDVEASKPVSHFIISFYSGSFIPAYLFLSKFKGVKFLCLELPSSSDGAVNNRCLFKWKVKFGTKIESLIFLSPNSISDKDADEENNGAINDMFKQNFDIAQKCLKNVMCWHILLLNLVKNLPMLEKVSTTDSERRGRLSLSGKKLIELKEWLHSASETVVGHVEVVDVVRRCYIPVLKLPVSGYVMKGIYFLIIEMKDLQGGYDGFMNSEDDFEDKEEAAYNEAVIQILEKHKGMILTWWAAGGVV